MTKHLLALIPIIGASVLLWGCKEKPPSMIPFSSGPDPHLNIDKIVSDLQAEGFSNITLRLERAGSVYGRVTDAQNIK